MHDLCVTGCGCVTSLPAVFARLPKHVAFAYGRTMKKNKIGPTNTGRRSRVDMAPSEHEESDPIAAAAQAKKTREGSLLNNAATSLQTGSIHD